MRKHTLLAALAAPLLMNAASLHIVKGDVEYVIIANEMGEAIYSDGNLTINNITIPVADITRMYVSDNDLVRKTVAVNYSAENANVMVSWDLLPYVSCTKDGAHVNLVQSDEVNESTGEITYILSGSSDNASFNLTGNYKATIELQGLSLTNPAGAPLNIERQENSRQRKEFHCQQPHRWRGFTERCHRLHRTSRIQRQGHTQRDRKRIPRNLCEGICGDEELLAQCAFGRERRHKLHSIFPS